jgi:hypothetical protein
MVSTVTVTGLIFAAGCNQPGMLSTGTKTELIKTIGKIKIKPAT